MSSSILGWQREHRPTGRLWAAIFEARGFEEVKDAKLAQKLYRSLPATLGEDGEAWWAEGDRGAVMAWLEDSQSTQPFHVFCHMPCSIENHGWLKLGSGWMALEAALPRIQSLEERLRKLGAPSRAKKAEYRDPRELRF